MRISLKAKLRFGLSVILSGIAVAAEKEVPVDLLEESALTWLGEGQPKEGADEIKIMSLSCRLCLDELVEVFREMEAGPRHLVLNTTEVTNFGIAWNWVTAVLAQVDEDSRRAVAMELLAIYVDSPEVYLNQPALWRDLCLERWGEATADPSDPEIWARGLNLLQRQNRLLGILGRGTTPDTLSLANGAVPIPVGKTLSPDDQRMQIWENSEPALRPNWEAVATDRGDARPVLHRVSLDPALKLKASSWEKLRRQLEGGGLFEWEAGKGLQKRVFRRWLAGMLSQPTLELRRAWFERAFAAAEAVAKSRRRSTSLIYAIESSMAAELESEIDAGFVRAAEFEVWAATMTN